MAWAGLALAASIAMLAYVYVGYPLLVRLLARLFPHPVRTGGTETPTVTVVITAFNEARHIADKLGNVLALDYPAHCIDVLVASDASSDATDAIVRGCASANVALLRIEGRVGKTACQNAAAAVARGEILLFTDATTRIGPAALRAMVRNFHDPEVGCVAGCLVYESQEADATGDGGRAYWGYESGLRQAESRLGSLIGVSGCLYAVRASAYRPIQPELISDFVTAMTMREQRLRTVLERTALCFESTLSRSDEELAMRVRVTLRSLAALSSRPAFLNPMRHGVFAWQLWSHKLLRYLSPAFCAIALLSNLVLALHGRWIALLVLQLVALSLGTLGFLPIRAFNRPGPWSKPYYFLLTNLASAVSLVRFARGHKVVTWTPLR